jgi:hypothetical protein
VIPALYAFYPATGLLKIKIHAILPKHEKRKKLRILSKTVEFSVLAANFTARAGIQPDLR